MNKVFIPVILLFTLINLSYGQEIDSVYYNGIGGGSPEEDVDMHDGHAFNDSLKIMNDSILISSLDSSFSPLDSLNLSDLVKSVLLDSSYWMSIDSSFAIFDSMNVDPYNIDGAKIKDTAHICLYDVCKDEDWSMPLGSGHYVTSQFGRRRYRWHYGTDIRLSIGDTVRSVWDGVVRISKYNYGGYGNYVMVRHHNGLETIYGHLSERLVKVGQKVKAGELIGLGGNTGRSSGPHLHFEVRYKGNPLDPENLFEFNYNTLAYSNYELTPDDFEYIREMRKAVYHRIRSGDTLGHIAVKYHTSINGICRLNGISRSKVLRIGQVLRVR